MSSEKPSEKIFLDPDVILKPVNFALHLAVFSEIEVPILIPLGWLWEELVREYTITTLADILYWHTDDIDRNLEEPIWSDTFYPLHGTSALLAASKKLGLIECVATKRYSKFFRTKAFGNWSTYLTDLVDNHWTEIPSSDNSEVYSKKLSLKLISNRLRIDENKLLKIYETNLDWEKRTPEGHQVFEEIRYTSSVISQLYSCIDLDSYFASSNYRWRNLIKNELNKESILELPLRHESLTPFLRILKMFPKNFTVGDIIKMIEARQLLNKLGVAEELLESIEEGKKKKEFAKSSLLYFIGIIPGAGNLASALGAAELIKQASDLFEKKEPLDSLLYSEISEWSLPEINDQKKEKT